MKISAILVLFSLATVSFYSIPANAQTAQSAVAAPAPVEVTAVKFETVRIAQDSWMEAEVEVAAKPAGRPGPGDFVDHVRVTLNLGFDLAPEGGVKKQRFYRASVEAVALEVGTKSTFRFYLPPEIVKRDKITTGEGGRYYVVELEAGGKVLSPTRGALSAIFKSDESMKNFLGLVGSEGGANEGVLIPQHLSPFAYDSRRPSPTILRREGQR